MSEKYLAKYVLVLLVVSKYFYLFPSSCFYLNEKICTGCVFNSAFFHVHVREVLIFLFEVDMKNVFFFFLTFQLTVKCNGPVLMEKQFKR